MLSRGKAREVGADLGAEYFGGAPGDTRDGLHERHGLLLRCQPRFELSVQRRNVGIQVVEVGELFTQQEDSYAFR
jgi:hypothetical protein